MYYVYIPTYVGVLGFGVRGSRQIFFARYTRNPVNIVIIFVLNSFWDRSFMDLKEVTADFNVEM